MSPSSFSDNDVIKKAPTKSDNRGILSTKAADALLDWVVFPLLLFIQFGATMYCEFKAGIPLPLDWKLVHSTILVFCIVAGLYRQVLREWSESIILLLLPEIFTNILLATVMFGDLLLAYRFLITSTIVMMVVGTAYSLEPSCTSLKIGPELDVDDYQRLVDEEMGDEVDEGSEEEWVC